MKKIIFFLFMIQSFLVNENLCQNFKVSSLIDIPGDNTELDAYFPEVIGIQNSETYICWINKLDSTYTVYLKQISPFIGDNIVVVSDKLIKSKPLIALNRNSQGIKIVWQCKRENTWQVYLANYFQSQLSEPEIILDSLSTEPQITLSINRIAWIENGNLYFANFYGDFSDEILVDSLTCSSPCLIKHDYLKSTQILYEKMYGDSIKIHMLQYNEYTTPIFEYDVLSNGILSKNPKFGNSMDLVFQTMENDVWKAVYTKPYIGLWDTTTNTKYNCNNPVVFTYDIPTFSSEHRTPYFIAFDADSLTDNDEIFVKTFYYDNNFDSLINVSNSLGDDRNPKIVYLSTTDSVYVSIIWEHSINGKTDLWMAKDSFAPISTGVLRNNENSTSFNLLNNYPNPFNPTTTIKYSIPEVEPQDFASVQLKVYDVLGREVTTLVNEEKPSGNYSVKFNGNNLPSGVYFYTLRVNNFVQSRKMILLR